MTDSDQAPFNVEPENAARISVQKLSVEYAAGARVLKELSLEIESGEIVALVGASGCGKSTLLRAIAGLLEPAEGAIAIEGLGPTRRSGDLSFVFQDPTLLPWRTVHENVRLPFELGGLHSSGRRASEVDQNAARRPIDIDAVEAALRAVGLAEESFKMFPRQLSGGMRMRTSIARALVTDPHVLLLDEPFAALDDLLRTRMNELILQLWHERRRTIVFVTHNIAEAVFLSHRVAVISKGKVVKLLDNDLPWPRKSEQRGTIEFAERYGSVSSALAETAQ